MRTPGGLIIPDPPPAAKPEERIHLVLSGRSRIVEDDDGYQGELILTKGGNRVRLRITNKQRAILSEMGIEEHT